MWKGGKIRNFIYKTYKIYFSNKLNFFTEVLLITSTTTQRQEYGKYLTGKHLVVGTIQVNIDNSEIEIQIAVDTLH